MQGLYNITKIVSKMKKMNNYKKSEIKQSTKTGVESHLYQQ